MYNDANHDPSELYPPESLLSCPTDLLGNSMLDESAVPLSEPSLLDTFNPCSDVSKHYDVS